MNNKQKKYYEEIRMAQNRFMASAQYLLELGISHEEAKELLKLKNEELNGKLESDAE